MASLAAQCELDVAQKRQRIFARPVNSGTESIHPAAVKPLLFIDFHGTISDGKFWSTLPLDHFRTIQARLFGNDIFLRNWMRGAVSSRHACEYAATFTGLRKDYLYCELIHSCQQIKVDISILMSIARLRDRYTTVLITANMDCFRATSRRLGLSSFFDDIVISADYGLLKEDKGGLLFKQVANAFHTSLSNSILLDDSAPICDVFCSLGGQAVRVAAVSDVPTHLARL